MYIILYLFYLLLYPLNTTRPSDCFDGDEYILADSAYTPTLTVVPILKNRASGLTKQEQIFIWGHAKARVKAEHCIGILKGRFQCLRELRVPITCKEDVAITNIWIRVCVVLHNFLLSIQDDIDEDWEVRDSSTDEEEDSTDYSSSSRSRSQQQVLAMDRNGVEKRNILINIINNNQ